MMTPSPDLDPQPKARPEPQPEVGSEVGSDPAPCAPAQTPPPAPLPVTPPAPPSPQASAKGRRDRRLPILLMVIALPLFMSTLDQTILILALPQIAQDLGLSTAAMGGLFSANMLAMLASIPLAGWAADHFGAKRMFLLAIAVFALGSLACGLCRALEPMVLARFVQGLGAGVMMPIARLILQYEVPKDKLLGAVAWYSIPAVMGPVLGPGLGGILLDIAQWPWIFFVNLPVALGALLGGAVILARDGAARAGSFDLRGYGYILLAITAALGVISGLSAPLGSAVEALWPIGCALACMGMLALYRRHSKRHRAPLIRIHILKDQLFRAMLLSGSLFRIGAAALPFICSLILQKDHGFDGLTTGMLLSALAFGALCAKPVTPFILGRLGYRATLFLDVSAVALSFLLLIGLFAQASLSPWLLAGVLALSGVFRSIHFTTLNTLCYADLPQSDLSSAAPLAALVQHLTSGLGIILAGALFAWLGESASSHLLGLAVFAAILQCSVIWFFALARDVGHNLLPSPRRSPPAANQG